MKNNKKAEAASSEATSLLLLHVADELPIVSRETDRFVNTIRTIKGGRQAVVPYSSLNALHFEGGI